MVPQKSTLIEYLDTELEIGRFKTLQECIDEERVKFKGKRARRRTLLVSKGSIYVEPPQSPHLAKEELEKGIMIKPCS